jgi:hypothetical protein
MMQRDSGNQIEVGRIERACSIFLFTLIISTLPIVGFTILGAAAEDHSSMHGIFCSDVDYTERVKTKIQALWSSNGI